MSERKPEDMQCILKVQAYIIAVGAYDEKDVKCDGEKCAQWSKGSGHQRCGLRNI